MNLDRCSRGSLRFHTFLFITVILMFYSLNLTPFRQFVLIMLFSSPFVVFTNFSSYFFPCILSLYYYHLVSFYGHNLVEFRFGLLICFQAVMNRIHTISVPYAVMKACPLSWVQRVHVHKGKIHLFPRFRNGQHIFLLFNLSLVSPYSSYSFGEVS